MIHIKLTLGAAFNKLTLSAIGLLRTIRLPVEQAWWLTKAVEKIDAEIKTADGIRLKLFERIGTKRKDGSWEIPKTDLAALTEFTKEMDPLMKREFKVKILQKIKLPSDLEISDAELSILQELGFIEKLKFEEPEEPETTPEPKTKRQRKAKAA